MTGEKNNPLLLGVTGGIASGKTAVADMLSEMGMPIIDFDVLARVVVEPDRPAWKQIVDYFGEQILQEDRSIDRKKLSGIVFNDAEKRKALESFTHPPIAMEFIEQVNEITARDPGAMIQVAVPLLIEANMQHMFHKVLVVHVPGETQIERLALRDGISRDEAATILAAQLPIDKKTEHADYVIDNSKSLEETRKQVVDLFATLKNIQECKPDGSSSDPGA